MCAKENNCGRLIIACLFGCARENVNEQEPEQADKKAVDLSKPQKLTVICNEKNIEAKNKKTLEF